MDEKTRNHFEMNIWNPSTVRLTDNQIYETCDNSENHYCTPVPSRQTSSAISTMAPISMPSFTNKSHKKCLFVVVVVVCVSLVAALFVVGFGCSGYAILELQKLQKEVNQLRIEISDICRHEAENVARLNGSIIGTRADVQIKLKELQNYTDFVIDELSREVSNNLTVQGNDFQNDLDQLDNSIRENLTLVFNLSSVDLMELAHGVQSSLSQINSDLIQLQNETQMSLTVLETTSHLEISHLRVDLDENIWLLTNTTEEMLNELNSTTEQLIDSKILSLERSASINISRVSDTANKNVKELTSLHQMDVGRLELQMTNNISILSQNITQNSVTNQNNIAIIRYELQQNISFLENETRRSLSFLMAEVGRVEEEVALDAHSNITQLDNDIKQRLNSVNVSVHSSINSLREDTEISIEELLKNTTYSLAALQMETQSDLNSLRDGTTYSITNLATNTSASISRLDNITFAISDYLNEFIADTQTRLNQLVASTESNIIDFEIEVSANLTRFEFDILYIIDQVNTTLYEEILNIPFENIRTNLFIETLLNNITQIYDYVDSMTVEVWNTTRTRINELNVSLDGTINNVKDSLSQAQENLTLLVTANMETVQRSVLSIERRVENLNASFTDMIQIATSGYQADLYNLTSRVESNFSALQEDVDRLTTDISIIFVELVNMTTQPNTSHLRINSLELSLHDLRIEFGTTRENVTSISNEVELLQDSFGSMTNSSVDLYEGCRQDTSECTLLPSSTEFTATCMTEPRPINVTGYYTHDIQCEYSSNDVTDLELLEINRLKKIGDDQIQCVCSVVSIRNSNHVTVNSAFSEIDPMLTCSLTILRCPLTIRLFDD